MKNNGLVSPLFTNGPRGLLYSQCGKLPKTDRLRTTRMGTICRRTTKPKIFKDGDINIYIYIQDFYLLHFSIARL